MKKVYAPFIILLLSFWASAQIPKLNLVQLATGFVSPVDIKNCGDERIFIVDRPGKILIMDKSGHVLPAPFLDISSKVLSAGQEQGLLGLAFSPNYSQDSTFYVNYITGTGSGFTVIARFHVSGDPNIADTGSEKVLLTFAQPYPNHKGGSLMFGPDGYLYDTQGDGGGSGDPFKNAQNMDVYLGKFLRLDVSNQDTTYMIPPTNPFIDSLNAKPEIWALGLRNPWRCSFDKITGDFWIGDVGQNLYEEIDFQPANSPGGQDYGWNCYEGFHVYLQCTSTRVFTFPVFEYVHSSTNGCAVIGGYVYRGAQYSGLFGKYLFTDFCSGRFLDITHPDSATFIVDTLQSFLINEYSCFGQDNNGELYIAGEANGIIYHIKDTSNCTPVAYILHDTLQNCTQVTLTALNGDSLHYAWYSTNGLLDTTSNQYTANVTGWYKVRVSKTEQGCEAFSDSVFVTILSDTLVPCNCGQSLCVNDAPLSLAERFTPFGGLYSGRGVVADSTLNPLVAGAGPDTIAYTYTNTFGCVTTDSLVFQVNNTTLLIDSAVKVSFCTADSAVNLEGFFVPLGGIYTGTAVTESYFNPSIAQEQDTVYYTYNNDFGCISTDSLVLQVNANTSLIDSAPGIFYCATDTPINLSGFIRPVGGLYTGTAVATNFFNPSGLANDTVYLNYTYTNTFGCVSADTFALIVTSCTEIEGLTGDFKVNIFPNPNDGIFNLEIQSNETDKLSLSIADESGRICFSQELIPALTSQTVKVGVPGLSKGLYLLQLTGAKGTIEKQLVIE